MNALRGFLLVFLLGGLMGGSLLGFWFAAAFVSALRDVQRQDKKKKQSLEMSNVQNIGWCGNGEGHPEFYRRITTQLPDEDLLHSEPPGCQHVWKCLGMNGRDEFVSQCQVCGEVLEQ